MTEEVDLIESPRRSWKLILAVILGILTVLVGFGAIGQLVGTGWFGHRPLLYGKGDLYVLNLHDETRYIAVDGREPVEIPIQNAEIVELIGGKSKVEVFDQDRNLIEVYEITTNKSHAFLNLSEDRCLVAADVSGLYGGRRQGMTIIEHIDAEQSLYIPETTNVIWPRRSFPAQLDGSTPKAVWIELVGCALLDDESFLQGYLDVRLERRMERTTGEDASP